DALARERKLDPGLVREWRRYLTERGKKTDPIFQPWFAFTEINGTNFAAAAKAVHFESSGSTNGQTSRLVAKFVIGTNAPESMKDVAQRYASLFKSIDEKWKAAREKDKSISKLADPSEEAIRQVLYASDSPTQV